MLPSRARADAFAFPPKNLRRMQIGHDRGRTQACPLRSSTGTLTCVGFPFRPPPIPLRFYLSSTPATVTSIRGRNVTMAQGTESNLGLREFTLPSA